MQEGNTNCFEKRENTTLHEEEKSPFRKDDWVDCATAAAEAAAVAKVGMINELFAPFSVLCSSIIGSNTTHNHNCQMQI